MKSKTLESVYLDFMRSRFIFSSKQGKVTHIAFSTNYDQKAKPAFEVAWHLNKADTLQKVFDSVLGQKCT